jgi:hypothetical protein
VFDAAGAKLKVLSDDGQIVYGAAFSADGTRLATASNKILVRDTATWDVTHALPLGGGGSSPCFDPAGEFACGRRPARRLRDRAPARRRRPPPTLS